MVKSMNSDLLDTTSVYIGRLKSKIGSLEKILNKFKKYDEERKQYYKDLAIRVGELESELSEYQDKEDPTGKLQRKVSEQRKKIKQLEALFSIKDKEELKDIDLILAKSQIIKLKNKINTLTKQNKSLKDTVSDLIYKLNKP